MASKTKYNPVTEEIADQLRAIVGEKYVIYGDVERLSPYSHDETPGAEYAHMPEVLVRPRSAAEISKIMKLANSGNKQLENKTNLTNEERQENINKISELLVETFGGYDET